MHTHKSRLRRQTDACHFRSVPKSHDFEFRLSFFRPAALSYWTSDSWQKIESEAANWKTESREMQYC